MLVHANAPRLARALTQARPTVFCIFVVDIISSCPTLTGFWRQLSHIDAV